MPLMCDKGLVQKNKIKLKKNIYILGNVQQNEKVVRLLSMANIISKTSMFHY